MRKNPVQYTVVGSSPASEKKSGGRSVGVLLLNRTSRVNREAYLEQIDKMGVREIVLVESMQNSFTVEELSKTYPFIRFLLLHKDKNPGSMINIGLNEMTSDFIFVFWSDMDPPYINSRLLQDWAEYEALVQVPLMRNDSGETIPSVTHPYMVRRNLRTRSEVPRKDGSKTLFPSDYTGIYRRDDVLKIGGFDTELQSPYWQKMDFGLRAFLWGFQIRVRTNFRISYRSEITPEDQTANQDYPRFFLKNLAVRSTTKGSRIPRHQLFSLAFGSAIGITGAWRLLKKISVWVKRNDDRFVYDATGLIRDWTLEE